MAAFGSRCEPRLGGRGFGLAAGVAADAVFGDPRRGHPVAGFGWYAVRVERAIYGDTRARGAAFTVCAVVPPVLLAQLVSRGLRRRPVGAVVGLAAGTWMVLGGASLAREAQSLATELTAGNLPGARRRLSALCARDSAGLGSEDLVRATVESVAENTADAVVAPLLWGSVAGLPGLVAYRAVNTLDAMVGYRTVRYRRFGWASARLDDLMNLLPARVTAALVALTAPVVGGAPQHVLRAVLRDGARHPSPNAGRVEAAFAGGLGVRLGGRNVYDGEAESRPVLGDGRPPGVTDVARAVRLCRAVTAAAAGAALFVGSRR